MRQYTFTKNNRNINATIAVLAITENRDARLYILKQVTKRLSIPDIGAFCAEVGASAEELSALIKDRAAQYGLLGKEYLI